MKKSIFKKLGGLFLGLAMGLGVAVGVTAGNKASEVNAADPCLDITHTNFTEITANYSTTFTHEYTVEGSKVNVSAYGVYKNSNGIQMNKGKSTKIYNTTPMPGNITKIECTFTATGKNSPTLYVGATQEAKTENLGIGSSSSKTQTYTPEAGSSYKYFYFDGSTVTGGCYMSSFKIYYSSGFNVTYNANGATSGSVPTDNTSYNANASVTVLGNTGNLSKTNYIFDGWNSNTNGTGTNYEVGTTFNISENTTLYAKWKESTNPTISVPSTFSGYVGETKEISISYANLTSGLNVSSSSDIIQLTQTSDSGNTRKYNVKFLSQGTATLSCKDGENQLASCSISSTKIAISSLVSSKSIQQGKSDTLTATVPVGSVTWSSNNSKVTVNNGVVSVAAAAEVNSTAIITATSTIDSTVTASCTITVTGNPFAEFTRLTSIDDVSTNAVYALSTEGIYWAGCNIYNNTISASSSSVAAATSIEDVGYYKLEVNTGTQGGYKIKKVVKNADGSFTDATSNKYLQYSGSSTNLSFNSNPTYFWTPYIQDNYVSLKMPDQSNRYLGWNNASGDSCVPVSSTNGIKAYTNPTKNTPVYLWEVPQNELDSVTTSGQNTSFTAGNKWSYGGTLTAHYTLEADATVTPTSFKFGDSGINPTTAGTAITTSTTLTKAEHDGKYIYVIYTEHDITKYCSYPITVNYKPATGIVLNLDEAPLSIGGSVTLTATISDEYADENNVLWSTTSAGIASISADSGTKSITVTGVSDGSATITATANGYSATCTVTVTADPILNLKDSDDSIINDATLEYFTGDDSVMIQAVSENVASPVFNWSNEDDSVVTIEKADQYCEVTIVGAGSSDVSVTVGALTRRVTFSIAQSGVTSLTLESSVPSGELFDGTYKNTLTLTPAVTLVGNATGFINWSSSDTDVATVSSPSTSGTAITVTGVGEGTATITARSAYTPATYAEYEVTVKGDGVESLSWSKRPKFNSGASGFKTIWAGETTLEDLMSQNGSDGIGIFAPSWKSEKSDTPSMGTDAHNVHIVLSSISGPTSEAGLTPLTSSYVFQASDNGKYVVAFYEGKASTQNTQLSVTNWRTVMESFTLTETFDYSAGGGNMSQSGDIATASIAKSGSTTSEADSLRLGSGKATGTLTVTSSTNLISKIEVWVKSWEGDGATLNVGDDNTGTISSSEFVKFEFTYNTPVSSVVMSTTASSKRVYVQKVVITSGGLNDIGKSADCLGLEVYIDTYLHMSDYTSSQGWCKDVNHNYYGKNTETGAKYYFNQLNLHQRTLLSSNSAYTDEWARLNAWAAANGESLNGSTLLAARPGVSPLLNIIGENTNTVAIIVIISMVSVTAIGGYFFYRKRKEI